MKDSQQLGLADHLLNPLSQQKRQELEDNPSSQIDTDARSTKKNNTWFFGYKGHIGVDIESKIIRKVTFTPANVHDSTQTGVFGQL